MGSFLQTLFSESFVPHGHCYLWNPGLVWLNVVSDAVIFLAYFSIPLQLLYIVKKRSDIPFDWVFCLFGSFIVACGLGHLMEVWTLWHPTYWLASLLKSFTAAISISTAIVLVKLIPQILLIPSPAAILEANGQLAAEIKERQEAEEALYQSQQMLQLVLDTFPQRVFWKNTELCYLGCNKLFAQDAGLRSPDDILDKDDFGLIWRESAALYQADDRHIIDTGIPKINYEEPMVKTNGEVLWLRTTKVPLRDEEGAIVGILGAYEDITEYKQAEAEIQKAKESAEVALKNFQQAQNQLIQAEKMSSLGQLVAGVAHEINNPVSFIYGNLNFISTYTVDLLDLIKLYQQDHPNPSAEIRDRSAAIDLEFLFEDLPKVLHSIKVGADRIRQIVLSLRNFSRLDQAEMKAVNIHDGIDSTLLILQHRLKGTAHIPLIEVVTQYGDLPLVECYPGQLNQVFMNLLSNAIDALEETSQDAISAAVNPPTITIHTQQLDEHRVQITITDNGPGISEKVRSRLFDPFFTTKPVGKGTGLGLSISYQIVVEKHGGTLECLSEEGLGTMFRVQIPIRAQSLSAAQTLLEGQPYRHD